MFDWYHIIFNWYPYNESHLFDFIYLDSYNKPIDKASKNDTTQEKI